MHWLRTDFKDAALKKGFHLMRDDLDFIEECLLKLLPGHRKAIARGYLEEWQKGMESPEKGKSPEASGRYRANSWIRGGVAKFK